jgi:hypothetical protein
MNGDSNPLSSRSLQVDPVVSSPANTDGTTLPPVDVQSPLATTIAGQKKANGAFIPKHVDFEAMSHESAVFILSTRDDFGAAK